MERFVGKGMALDPDKYFIILPGQFGNGLSSSPSNTPPPFNQGAFQSFALIVDDPDAPDPKAPLPAHRPAPLLL
jgi:homoserine O-acetyltransferase/O-succinyltransferase